MYQRMFASDKSSSMAPCFSWESFFFVTGFGTRPTIISRCGIDCPFVHACVGMKQPSTLRCSASELRVQQTKFKQKRKHVNALKEGVKRSTKWGSQHFSKRNYGTNMTVAHIVTHTHTHTKVSSQVHNSGYSGWCVVVFKRIATVLFRNQLFSLKGNCHSALREDARTRAHSNILIQSVQVILSKVYYCQMTVSTACLAML